MAVITRTISDSITYFDEDINVSNMETVPYYGSYIKANNYFASMFEGKMWNTYEPIDRRLALTSATKLIENLNFAGSKTDPNQYLEFPREGDTEVPYHIEHATYEVAYALLRGIDPDTERDNLFKSTRGYGGLSATNRTPESVQPWIVAGIPSARAWDYLKPYLSPRVAVRLLRT